MMHTVIDLVVIGTIAVSALFGWLRGFCTEASSLLGWLIALWLTLMFTQKLSIYLEPHISQPQMRLAITAFAIFFISLLAVNAISVVLKTLMAMLGLSMVDRTLGLGFGFVRGLLVIGGLLLIGVSVGWQEESWWKTSHVIPKVQVMSAYCWKTLPKTMSLPIEKWFHAEFSGTKLSAWMETVKKP